LQLQLQSLHVASNWAQDLVVHLGYPFYLIKLWYSSLGDHNMHSYRVMQGEGIVNHMDTLYTILLLVSCFKRKKRE
jgi:hypothetical protein